MSEATTETRELTTPPQAPGARPLVGHLLEGWRRPLSMLLEGRRACGRTQQYWFGPYRYVIVSRAEDVRRVLVSHRDNYPKSVNYRGLKLVLGEGLLTSEGELWKRQRRLAQPAFHHRSLVGFADTKAGCAADKLERGDRELVNGELDVHEEMMRVTFRIVGKTLCSVDLETEAQQLAPAITEALLFANDYAEAAVRIPTWVPTPRNLRFRRALAELDGLILGIIAERRRSGEEKGDLLDMLMGATDESGKERMSDRQLRDELMTLILAGHETTAVAMSWTFLLLSQHPDVARRVHQEARRVLGDRPARFEDLGELELTKRVMQESMRLYPPAWIFERQAVQDDVLDGHRIPAGTVVAVSPYLLHREPELWDNPEGFDPDRFAAGDPDKYAYMPFGGGPRICIGNHFAMMEAQILLAMVAARFRLDLVPGHPVEMDPGITLRPKHGIRMALRRREGCDRSRAAA